jgi:hypothetical protein
MDIELTNEAAEMIGQYTGGKDKILADLLKRGGIIRKEIDPEGRIKGYERVKYYFPDGGYAIYDPARLEIYKKRKKEINKKD